MYLYNRIRFKISCLGRPLGPQCKKGHITFASHQIRYLYSTHSKRSVMTTDPAYMYVTCQSGVYWVVTDQRYGEVGNAIHMSRQ